MPLYFYRAINESGNTVTGEMEAESLEAATLALSSRGFIPATVREKGLGLGTVTFMGLQQRLTPVRAPDLILFTKQFRTMFRAGIPILNLLQVMENQTANLKLRAVIGAMRDDVRQGASLYDAFRRHPRIFSPLYCAMVRAGEASDALPQVLERLIYIISHEHKVRSDIRSALQYPIIVLTFLALAFFVLLTFVIPKFANIFMRAGLDLPLPTRICMLLYSILTQYWYIAAAVAVGAVIAGVLFFKTDRGRYVKDSVAMRLPLIGPLMTKAAMSRFASIFSILQASGVPVLDSMRILSDTIGNATIAREFNRIRSLLEEGRGIARPLRTARYFTPMVINMVAVGEESGKLDEMLSDVSEHYDSELEYAITKLTEMIGPMLTLGLAAVVGFFALAIFLPMWDLTRMVQR
jgi:type IV pilus assembly protein PilC